MKCKVIALTVRIEEEDGQFTAECVELGTATCGDTYNEAMKNIQEAIKVDLSGLEEIGTIEKFLKERKIKVVEKEVPVSHRRGSVFTETVKSDTKLELAFCL